MEDANHRCSINVLMPIASKEGSREVQKLRNAPILLSDIWYCSRTTEKDKTLSCNF